MADIKIERKRGPGLVPLLIIALIVIALLWWFLGRTRADEPVRTSDRGAVAPPAAVGWPLSGAMDLSAAA
jgi:hypothetical protein